MEQDSLKPPDAPATGAKPRKRPAWFSSLFTFRFFSSEDAPKISPQAVVDPKADIADDVEVGPFCVIGPDVKIGAGCRLLNSVTILGDTTIGRDNVFFPNTVIGGAPQDKKYKGARTRLTVGNGNVFREACTIHTGTEKGGGVTRVGDNNLLMVNCHLGHDVALGSSCVLANNVMIAGHVVIGDYVNMMGGVGVHHFVTIGDYAYIGGYARIHHDVPPFVKIDGADEVRRLKDITLPLLTPTTLFLAVISVLGALQVFTEIYIMTSGGPLRSTTTIVYHIYTTAFRNFDMGYAAAMAFGLFAMMFVFTLVQLRAMRSEVEY